MLKIPCLFVRDFSQRPPIMFHVVTDGCEWVTAGEGTHTRKWDGTAVLARDGKLYARFDCKKGRTPPDGFEPSNPSGLSLTSSMASCIRTPRHAHVHPQCRPHQGRHDHFRDQARPRLRELRVDRWSRRGGRRTDPPGDRCRVGEDHTTVQQR